MAWQNAFAPSFGFGRLLASVFLMPRGRLFVCGEGWGFPGMELYVIEMEFENVHSTLVFTVFYGFVSIHRSIESVGCCADKLRVCPRRKTIFQSSFDMDKNPCFIFPIGTMVSGFF